MLGVTTDVEREVELQQQTIEALKDKIYRLETDLRETTYEMEMTKLKLEIRAAGSRKGVDKAVMAQPLTCSRMVEAVVETRDQNHGEYLDVVDTSVGSCLQTSSIGVSCSPLLQNAAVGPDFPMNHWIVKESVETCDMGVEQELKMCDKCVGVDQTVSETRLCVEDVNELSQDKVVVKDVKSVACGDCSVDVIIKPLLDYYSRGVNTELVTKMDSAINVAPWTTSQQTNTEFEVSNQTTNTEVPGLVDASTNTAYSMYSKHTNTESVEMRSVAIGDGKVKEIDAMPKTRSIGIYHYIERVQKLLQEQQMLLAENYTELAETFGEPYSQIGTLNSQLISTISSINSVMKCGSNEDLQTLGLQKKSLELNLYSDPAPFLLKGPLVYTSDSTRHAKTNDVVQKYNSSRKK
ncbi:unnamed protein product [Ranitomeya imitator]|uniref:Uncharacterized protein n=1 Tax=Ranitomeya imitator TaxID=111125 RepID=A0ABN9MPA8_9NEOB|nr:unnamed protein product [Ranitomeya imitator]